MGIFKAAVYAAFGLAVSGSCVAATVWEHYPPFMNPGVAGIVVGDFDGDGREDVVVSGTTLHYSGGPGNLLGWFASDAGGRLSLRTLSMLPPTTPAGPPIMFAGKLKLMPREGQADRVIGVVSNNDWTGFTNEIVVYGGIPLRMQRAIPAPGIMEVVVVADVDADGALEIVALAHNTEGGLGMFR